MDDVDVSVDVTTGLERKLTIKIPHDRINQQIQHKLNELTQKARLKGFSPGRAVPLKVVEQRFGKSVREEVVGKLSEPFFTQVIEQEKLKLASLLSLRVTRNEAGEDAEIEALIEVFPDIAHFKDLTGIEFEKLVPQVTQADVEETLKSLQKKYSKWVEVDRQVQKEDKVTIDYVPSIAGEPDEKAAQQGIEIELGSEAWPKEFETCLLGLKVGSEFTIELALPEDFHQKDLAGKQVQFKGQLKAIAEPKLPELDADFARKFNIPEGGIEALRKEIYDNLWTQLDYKVQSLNKEAVLNKLWELNSLEVPPSLVAKEIEHLQAYYQTIEPEVSKDQNVSHTKVAQDKLNQEAERKVGLAILLQEYAKMKGIKVDPERVEQRVTEMSKGYEHPEQLKAWLMADPKRMGGISASVLEDEVVEKLLEDANTTEKSIDLDSARHANID